MVVDAEEEGLGITADLLLHQDAVIIVEEEVVPVVGLFLVEEDKNFLFLFILFVSSFLNWSF